MESTVWGRRFFLSAWPPLYTRNSFGPVFYGLLTERPDGTWLTGRFLLYPVVIGFLIVWFGGASFGLGLAVYFAIAESGGLEAWAPRTLAPVGGAAGVLLFGYVLVRFGIRSARSQRASIERYLESVLGARRRAPTGGGGPV